MYLYVEFDYGCKWGEFTADDYAEIRAAVPSLPAEQPQWTPAGAHLITHESMPTLIKYKMTFHLADSPESQGIGSMLVKLQDRIASLELRDRSTAELVGAGAAVQITIPDLGLLYINEVTHLNDACTDDLRSHLDDGWKILAVCPPNASRRPDYILGRRKP